MMNKIFKQNNSLITYKYLFGIMLDIVVVFLLTSSPISVASIQAQITNPAIGELGGNTGNIGYNPNSGSISNAKSGSMLLNHFVRYWGVAISLGAVILLGMLVMGGIEWISAGGDKGKLEKARSRITQSIIGMFILATSFILIGFISSMLFGDNLNLLNLNLYFAK